MTDRPAPTTLFALAYDEERNYDPAERTDVLMDRCLNALGLTLAHATPAEALDASDPVAQAKFALHRFARTTEDAKIINRMIDDLAARLSFTEETDHD